MELHDVSYGIEYVARPLLLFFSSENRLLCFSAGTDMPYLLDGYGILSVDSKNLLDRVFSSKHRVFYHRCIRFACLLVLITGHVSKQTIRRHFKSLSLDKLRSPDFNLFSYQEYLEEEEAEAIAETMEQYISKTRTDYGLGVARPKIEEKDSFELKGQFLKELRENTFSGSDNEDANEHIEKVLKIVDLFHVPNITKDQLMLRFLNKYCPPGRTAKKIEEINNFQQEPDETLYQAWERFKELLMKCPQHYLTEMQEVILFYNGLDVPTRQILDSRGVVPTKTAADAKKAIQEMAEYSQKWHNGTSRGRSTETSDGLAAIQAQLNNLGREIKKVNEKVYAAQVGCEQCKGPHYTKDCPQKEEGNALEEAYYTQFGGPFQGGGYRATAPGYYQRNNANPSFQE
ncbi:reverse transcriptase domain-containing protein [Tanacetum coccineum]